MGIGDVTRVTVGDCTDLHYVDTGMYDTAEYGSVYLLDYERPAIVDSGIGTNYERILAALDEVGIDHDDLAAIVLTHVHLDHAGGAGFLAEACPNATVYAPHNGARHVRDPSRLVEGTKAAVGDQWRYYVEPKPVPEDRLEPYEDGDVIGLGTHELRAHAAPGHAPHHFVFEDPANDAVFTADGAGIWVPAIDEVRPTSPPPQFDLAQCLADVETIRDLDPSTLCFAHFGPRETGDVLDAYAETLSAWVESVREQRAELGDDEAVIEHFADATDLDSVWGETKARGEVSMNVRGVLTSLDG
ncbi:beta-lactamase [Halovivax asiaticus JCM 14624]|uniref:Beta-lactamase n=1 Tax=Halovivax asiaticus JCM 14624 TaxID=1227490 RepID=M0BJ08_9EURY|nr:MBL fold metallo-hydrolase [Halovivax asiaticus]ELZ10840.1 beta-lactamase [Halovivax asiaticus JCM 14624]